ncbi:MAG TPA: hypothetical protein VHW23_13105 [Kofleriaceae bacterium]|jgi:hypothetical protein|nr:hypothetical protein [Kofleriaceae bacterium]
MKLAALFLATLAACMDPTPEAAATADVTAADTAEAPAIHPAACTQVTTCDLVCSEIVFNKVVRFGTDRVHLVCDDGSDTVLHQNPCGEACR